VSELIAFVFRDQYRAPEVLNELRRREWCWTRDLDEAIAITVDHTGRSRVHLSVDPTKDQTSSWARLWSSLLNKTLFLPLTEVMVDAVNCFSTKAHHLSLPAQGFEETPEAKWWRESLGPNGNFQRDVAALMVPRGSAIFLLLRADSAPVVLNQLRNYGDTLVHTSVNQVQDEKLDAILASIRSSRS
jgi:uncharacterized membrane protein